MEVKGDIQLGKDLPELVVGRLVVVQVCLAVWTGVLEVAEESTVESELLDTATQFLASLLRVVHRQAGKSTHAVAVVFDLLGSPVVGLKGCLLSRGLVGNALDTGDGQGDDSVSNAVSVGQTKTLAIDVVDLAHVAGAVLGGNVQRSFGLGLLLLAGTLIGLFENDFAQHVESL